MKKDELKKLRAKPIEDLKKEIFDSSDKLRVLRFDLASGKTKNTSLVRSTRKRISTVRTLIQEKLVDNEVKANLEVKTETK